MVEKVFTETITSVTMDEGESKITLIKPGSQEHAFKLIYIYQDAYGDVKTGIETVDFILTYFPSLKGMEKQVKEIAEGITFLTPIKDE